jgi:hypothetical protein
VPRRRDSSRTDAGPLTVMQPVSRDMVAA